MNLSPYITASGGGGNADNVVDISKLIVLDAELTEWAWSDTAEDVIAYAD